MQVLKFVKLYISTFAFFLAIDLVWLGVVAKNFYQHYLGFLLKSKPNLLAAFLFYLLFVMANLVFAVWPSFKQDSFLKPVLLGAFLGLVSYATYDLSNLATLKNWPWQVVIVDICWGTILSASTALAGFLIAKKIF